MSTGVVPEGTGPEEIEVKSVEWLERNAGAVDIASARGEETEAWQRGKQNASDAAVEVRQDVGAAVVRLPDGDPHATLLVEGAGSDNGPFAGACDCKGYQYHDGPCTHLVTRAVRSILRPGEVPEEVRRYQELANAGGPAPDVDPDDAMSDIGGLDDGDEERADQKAATDGAGNEDVVDVDAAGQPVGGPGAGDQHPPDEIVDVPVDADEDHSVPATPSDPFATQLAENVPERYVMQLNGNTYVHIAGYAAIARQAGLRMDYEPLTRARETEYEHAEYEAVVTTPGGEVIARDMGTAHAELEDMSDAEASLDELAITRAYRRAIRLATGGGATLQRGDGE
jgi:hypothetical protein